MYQSPKVSLYDGNIIWIGTLVLKVSALNLQEQRFHRENKTKFAPQA